MVDEADKAPTHVTAVLQAVVEDGRLVLGDGRVVGEDIPVHPDFRMILLANRPGFPFLGNAFHKVIGSAFACFAVDNPDSESELALLRAYARGRVPDVPQYVELTGIECINSMQNHLR